MTVNEQRRQILQMLAEGAITAEDAEQLIEALETEQPVTTAGAPTRAKSKPKYMRVVIDAEEGGDGPTRVNVQIPLQLLRAGVRLTSVLPPQALERVNEKLHRSGVPIDLTDLKPQHLEELIEHLDDMTVDVDQRDAKVKVFWE